MSCQLPLLALFQDIKAVKRLLFPDEINDEHDNLDEQGTNLFFLCYILSKFVSCYKIDILPFFRSSLNAHSSCVRCRVSKLG